MRFDVRLLRSAARLGGPRAGLPLPLVLAFTDPQRTPDPCALAAALPRGTALVYRAFGAPEAHETARRLAAICRRRGVVLLIGRDVRLARQAWADGLHLPEWALDARRPTFSLVTGAAHGPRALAAAGRAGLDAAVLSPVFASRSASAGKPLGPWRAGHWARRAGLPVYALGGIDAKTARRLPKASFAGLAAVDGVLRT